MRNLAIFFLLFSNIFVLSCKKENDQDDKNNQNNEPLSCSITYPTEGSMVILEAWEGIVITVSTTGNVSEVIYYRDSVKLGKSNSSPYSYNYNSAGYLDPDEYTIRAIAYGTAGDSVFDEVAFIMQVPQNENHRPIPDFNVNVPSIGQGNEVTLINLTVGQVDSYLWNFGDGTTSADINPTHVYTTQGFFNVSLAATNYHGTRTESKPNFIQVNGPLTGSPCSSATTVSDGDGNIYPTVQIGNQCWMAHNINVGTRIDSLTIQSDNSIIENKFTEMRHNTYFWTSTEFYSYSVLLRGLTELNGMIARFDALKSDGCSVRCIKN